MQDKCNLDFFLNVIKSKFYFKIVICEMKKTERDKKSNVREKKLRKKIRNVPFFILIKFLFLGGNKEKKKKAIVTSYLIFLTFFLHLQVSHICQL